MCARCTRFAPSRRAATVGSEFFRCARKRNAGCAGRAESTLRVSPMPAVLCVCSVCALCSVCVLCSVCSVCSVCSSVQPCSLFICSALFSPVLCSVCSPCSALFSPVHTHTAHTQPPAQPPTHHPPTSAATTTRHPSSIRTRRLAHTPLTRFARIVRFAYAMRLAVRSRRQPRSARARTLWPRRRPMLVHFQRFHKLYMPKSDPTQNHVKTCAQTGFEGIFGF
jgi:hypothetical protein